MLNTNKAIQVLLVCLLSFSLFSCLDDDDAPVPVAPTIEKVEIGLNNNEIGVNGQDFYFNADIQAGDKIDLVQVKIQQLSSVTYASTWNHEVTRLIHGSLPFLFSQNPSI